MQESKNEITKFMEENKLKGTVDSIVEKVDIRGLKALGNLDQMKKKFDEFKERQSLIDNAIQELFIAGEDFGPADDRNPKPVLLKGGAEKACKLFGTHATFKKDTDSWEMAGSPSGTICYICYIIDDETGNIIGEGRGAETKGNKGRDLNKTIKNAEKCALVDAALYTFNLSNKFTQDHGAKQTMTLNQWKQELIADIGVMRHGVESGITDLVWLQTALQAEIHKKSINTLGEHNHMRKMIFEDKKFDLRTGEINANTDGPNTQEK